MTGPRGVIVAGTHSGCGKTSVSLGLMAAFARRGMQVQGFKAGPDFIDPGHHQAVTGRVSHNLDGWMTDRETVRNTFARSGAPCDMTVVEGVMGLYDGFSGTSDAGSAAQLARWLELPVILVVDARSMARSAAAVVRGFADFDPRVRLAGVVFNRVGSPRHREILEQAMTELEDVPLLGCLDRKEGLTPPSRHLGLLTAGEWDWNRQRTDALADWVERGIDLDALFERLPRMKHSVPVPEEQAKPHVRIGLARDQAFCFYYEENLRLLRKAGADLVPFSPMHDDRLPENLDGLYLGGGYPEVYGEMLAANTSMREAIRKFAEQGCPVYGECGGFMYLTRELTDKAGNTWPMVGMFDVSCVMQPRFAALGYREVRSTASTLLGPAGTVIRGHEFHYSRTEGEHLEAESVYSVTDRRGPNEKSRGWLQNRTLGSYVHLHFGSDPQVAETFVAACLEARDEK